MDLTLMKDGKPVDPKDLTVDQRMTLFHKTVSTLKNLFGAHAVVCGVGFSEDDPNDTGEENFQLMVDGCSNCAEAIIEALYEGRPSRVKPALDERKRKASLN